MQKETKKQCEHNYQAAAEYALFLGAWIRRKVVRNQNSKTEEWKISLDPVIRYFVPPVPLREENHEAKEGERSQYSSMVVMKNRVASPHGHFCEISSVSTEQQQIYATKYPSVRAPEKPAASKHLEKVEIPADLSKAENTTNEQQW